MNQKEDVHEIDLEAAAKTLHAQYFIRLMWTVNDLLALRHLQKLNEDGVKAGNPLALSTLMYTIKMSSGHIFEAVNKMVTLLEPKKGKKDPVYIWIEQRPKLLAAFQEVSKLADSEHFKNLAAIRNSFVFHYNYSEGSKVTVNALNQRVEELKSISAQPVGELYLSPSEKEYRFLVADEVMSAAWRTLTGVPFAQEYKGQKETDAQVKYRLTWARLMFILRTLASSNGLHPTIFKLESQPPKQPS